LVFLCGVLTIRQVSFTLSLSVEFCVGGGEGGGSVDQFLVHLIGLQISPVQLRRPFEFTVLLTASFQHSVTQRNITQCKSFCATKSVPYFLRNCRHRNGTLLANRNDLYFVSVPYFLCNCRHRNGTPLANRNNIFFPQCWAAGGKLDQLEL